MTEMTNVLAVQASGHPEAREKIISENEQIILRTASRFCRKFITHSDDEWSVSLCAFSRAIDIYTESKGDFLPFAQMLIKRSLTDYYRARANQKHEISVAPEIFEGNTESSDGENGSVEGTRLTVVQQCTQEYDNPLRMEILTANTMLQDYGFRFFDLVSCSPKQDRSRVECAAVVRAALKSSELCRKLKETKKLPVRDLCKVSGVSRKTIDRYRKYLIMAILILDDDYPYLSDYLRFIKNTG